MTPPATAPAIAPGGVFDDTEADIGEAAILEVESLVEAVSEGLTDCDRDWDGLGGMAAVRSGIVERVLKEGV